MLKAFAEKLLKIKMKTNVFRWNNKERGKGTVYF